MEATLRQDVLTETYNDVENLINEIVWRFCERYGGEFKDYRAEANLLFILAYDCFDETKGALSTHLYFRIWKGLLSFIRLKIKQRPSPKVDSDVLLQFEDWSWNPFSVVDLIDEANEDVRTLINLIWEPNEEIINTKMKTGQNPCHFRAVLKNYLRNIGWTQKRVRESFVEITKLINS